MAVVTISRQYGSGGHKIAGRVSDLLDYRFFDKEAVAQAAQNLGLNQDYIIDHPEMVYEEKGFRAQMWDLLFGAKTMTIGSRERPQVSWGGLEARLDEDWFVEMVNATIREAHRQGNVVIVGRGGQAVLQEEPDVLHVRIEAPYDTRLWRLQAYEGINNADEGKRLIERIDRRSADYLRRFHQIDWDDPLLYHMVINTGKISLEIAAQMIVTAVQEMEAVAAAP